MENGKVLGKVAEIKNMLGQPNTGQANVYWAANSQIHTTI